MTRRVREWVILLFLLPIALMLCAVGWLCARLLDFGPKDFEPKPPKEPGEPGK